ncbi:MAG: serine/threonine protein kinase, partial [Thermoleophilia bacterium]|nr:serine/threonine protein kinase [Thermoleophilia bacterium]
PGDPATEAVPHPFGFDLGSGQVVVRHLHRGADTDVYETWSQDRLCNCVVKVLRPGADGDAAAARRVRAEGRHLLGLTHPHVVRCYGTHDGPPPSLVLERVPGTTAHLLVHALGTLVPWPDIVTWGVQVGSALHHMHGQGVVHLDVKPGNVIVHGQHATLIDLHLARAPGDAARAVGTPGYIAPETASGEPASAAADVWGLGALLYELAAGRPAFPVEPGTTPERAGRAPGVATVRSLPARLGTIIDACIDPDPGARPDLVTVIATLQS